MKKHLFLTGPAGCGKSEALRAALGDRMLLAGGFVCLRERGTAGELLGCSLLPAAAAGGAEGYSPLPYLDLRQAPPVHDSEVFREDGVRLLQESVWYPFSVLDAIGGFELLIPQFRQALAGVLSSDQPLVGVLMEPKEAEALCARLGLSDRVNQNIARLWEALKADPDTQILELAGLRRTWSLRLLEEWTEAFAR